MLPDLIAQWCVSFNGRVWAAFVRQHRSKVVTAPESSPLVEISLYL